ncbi:MAG: MmcQ/YjbR family DNA-binding protein [Deltaproteobacteria bacterium]|nr:MmcQ/YjbR family DNA-binding protein [Deltaproteobacteria bacterium]
MDLATLRSYLQNKRNAVEDYPFGPEYMVFKVGGRMFALVAATIDPLRMNLKCRPEDAVVLRDIYEAVKPGYHMNKRHWNTVVLDGSIPDELVRVLIDDSYELVVEKLPRPVREQIRQASK